MVSVEEGEALGLMISVPSPFRLVFEFGGSRMSYVLRREDGGGEWSHTSKPTSGRRGRTLTIRCASVPVYQCGGCLGLGCAVLATWPLRHASCEPASPVQVGLGK